MPRLGVAPSHSVGPRPGIAYAKSIAAMTNTDLHVSCAGEVKLGSEMEFQAERLSTPAAARWVLCLSTDRRAIRLTNVSPAPSGYVMDREGVLGLIFPASVTAVTLHVASADLGMSEWRFWVDDAAAAGSDGRASGASPTR